MHVVLGCCLSSAGKGSWKATHGLGQYHGLGAVQVPPLDQQQYAPQARVSCLGTRLDEAGQSLKVLEASSLVHLYRVLGQLMARLSYLHIIIVLIISTGCECSPNSEMNNFTFGGHHFLFFFCKHNYE